MRIQLLPKLEKGMKREIIAIAPMREPYRSGPKVRARITKYTPWMIILNKEELKSNHTSFKKEWLDILLKID
jgi:hypothetical protein